MSKIEVDQLDPQSSTNLTIGTSGDTIKTGTGTSLVVQGDGSSANGLITLNCSQNSHGVKLSSPDHSGGQSYTMKLPATNITAGKFLKVDSITGSGATAVGQLSFADAGGGGKIGQVISTAKTDVFTTTSTSFTDITGLSVSITPSATTSKIYIMSNFQVRCDAASGYFVARMLRGSTVINAGATAGNRVGGFISANIYNADNQTGMSVSTAFLDSPSTTSATTYKIRMKSTGGNDFGVGSINGDNDSSHNARSASVITVMEVLA